MVELQDNKLSSEIGCHSLRRNPWLVVAIHRSAIELDNP